MKTVWPEFDDWPAVSLDVTGDEATEFCLVLLEVATIWRCVADAATLAAVLPDCFTAESNWPTNALEVPEDPAR